MNARTQPPFPPNPQPGQKWGAWTWTGSRWACTRLQGVFVNVQTFPASAPYTPTPGLTSLTVESWGGGAGGGGAIAGGGFAAIGGGGGGSGGYSRVTLAATLVLGGVAVTIGAGGAGATTAGASGTNGGATSFGALCVANGGLGGLTGGGAASGYGGGGAAPGLGDLAFAGNAGQTGGYALTAEEVAVEGGLGGAGPASGGVAFAALTLANSNISAPGGAGMSPGAGGGGACSANTAATPVGGAGAAGLCVVTETCWADTGDEGDCGCGPTGGQARIAAWPGGFGND
jgi:hypothetical protein